MAVVFGINCGNSSCSIAAKKNDRVEIIANTNDGQRTTPAIVTILENEIVTGQAAKQGLQRRGPKTIVGVLRDISTKEPKRSKAQGMSCCPAWDDDGDVSYTVELDTGSKIVPAANVLKHIFSEIKRISSTHHSNGQCTACLCLPSWVSKRAVAVAREAARDAGFKVVGLVLQPVAACLAYNIHQDKSRSSLVLSLHFGESSGSASLLEISGGLATVRDTAHTSLAPGSTITNKMVEHLAKEFYTKYRGDCLENKKSRQKLYNQAEEAKHVLSTMQVAQIHVDSLWEGVDFSCQVTRARFEGLISSTLLELLGTVQAMLERNSITAQQINKVVLTGGTCKIPRLQQLVTERFLGAELLCSIPTDEALACGAAEEASAISYDKSVTVIEDGQKKKGRGSVQRKQDTFRSHNAVLLTALSSSIWCKANDNNESICILPRLTPPFLRNSSTLPVSGSNSVTLVLYEAEQPTSGAVPAHAILAELCVPTASDSTELILDCILNSEGKVVVTLKEPTHNKKRSFQLCLGATHVDSEGSS